MEYVIATTYCFIDYLIRIVDISYNIPAPTSWVKNAMFYNLCFFVVDLLFFFRKISNVGVKLNYSEDECIFSQ